jgi:hypothetical protein
MQFQTIHFLRFDLKPYFFFNYEIEMPNELLIYISKNDKDFFFMNNHRGEKSEIQYLSFELWLHGIHKQDCFGVGQGLSSAR